MVIWGNGGGKRRIGYGAGWKVVVGDSSSPECGDMGAQQAREEVVSVAPEEKQLVANHARGVWRGRRGGMRVRTGGSEGRGCVCGETGAEREEG